MNTQRTLTLLASVLILSGATLFAQGGLVESRDQAQGWYVPVQGRVKVDAGKTKPKDITVTVYKDNQQLTSFITKKGKFSVELDLDQNYAIYIAKPGYKTKLILVDSHLPGQLVKYPAYPLFVDLVPETNADRSEDLFTGFPDAIIRYNAEMGGHFPSQAYMHDVQARQGSVVQARP